jgi:hypothetical protein
VDGWESCRPVDPQSLLDHERRKTSLVDLVSVVLENGHYQRAAPLRDRMGQILDDHEKNLYAERWRLEVHHHQNHLRDLERAAVAAKERGCCPATDPQSLDQAYQALASSPAVCTNDRVVHHC